MDNNIINPTVELEQIKEEVIDYKIFMNERNKGNYSIDGAVNIDKWNASKYKILFVLKETAGYQNCNIFELQDELKSVWLRYKQSFKNGKRQNPTYKNAAWLAKSLQIALENNRILTQVEIKNMDTKPESLTEASLTEAIDYCAIINLKKHSNPNPDKKSNDEDIRSEYRENKKLLEWQIKELSPNVVVAGSSVVWECLSNKGNGLYKDIITSNLRKNECKSFNGIVFYHAYHPSAYGKYKWDIHKIHKQIFGEIKLTIV